jgi:hypothetical protein
MRTPESKIKQAILHPVDEIRETALRYFSDARLEDHTIMPLVIEAVERYGRDTAYNFLRDAERLPQTDATVDWLIGELRRDYDLDDVNQDNYRYAVAWILYKAPQPLLWKRLNEIFTAPAFPERLHEPFSERLNRFSWDWDRAWTALKYFGQDTMRRGTFTHNDIDWAAGIVEALARHRKKKAKTVLALLEAEWSDEDDHLMNWLRPCFMDLAGEMRLEETVPLLMDYLGTEPDLDMSDSAATALQRIGGDIVVREIEARWWHADDVEFRRSAACILAHIRSDFCIERSLAFFKAEEEPETQLILADALLSNFSEEAVDLVLKLIVEIDNEQLQPDEWDLRYRLVAVCTIKGREFPLFDQWHTAALHDNWGRFDLEPSRVADSYRPDQFGPKWSVS